MDFEVVQIGALGVQRATTPEVVEAVFSALARGEGGRVATVNVEFLQRAAEDPALAALYQGSEIRVADGMPVLWLARIAGAPLPERVAGSDLVWRFAERAAREGRSLFLLGGDAGVAERAAEILRERVPGTRIAGLAAPRISSPPSAAELAALQSQLCAAAPDLIYCAFGTPKQEQIAAALAKALPRSWWLGCGVSLSFIAGRVPRAPGWLQRLGLEWLHRTAQEPGRLAGRYLLRNLPFLARAVASASVARLRGRT
jgi:N-acetylglucosaminyldiphosphoundecaprenol N-acetyl-beta-D-mannosaminyltransferase